MTVLPVSRPAWAIHLLGTAVFACLICLPLFDAVFHAAPEVNVMEAGPGASPFDGHGPAGVLRAFNILRGGYLEKAFGFRKLLVKYENYLNYCLLDSSTADLSVVAGPGGWLFLAKENPTLNTVEDYRGTRLFTPQELAAWTAEFTARRDWLAQRDIPYLVVVAPNKQTIYPEKLPARYNRVSPATRTDQLIAALAGAGVAVADLRPVLLDLKKSAQAYYRTDSHWTPVGARAAAGDILAALAKYFPGLGTASQTDLQVIPAPGVGGDLAAMLGLGDCFVEDKFSLAPKDGFRAVPADASGLAGPRDIGPADAFERPDSGLPRAVIFRDSFGQDLIPFLSEHFSRSVYQWPFPSTAKEPRRFDRELILAEKPDVVVDEIVERYFTVPLAASR
ncbi:alginate O-acetyltransferase AlgX-related protein [Desulfolutivibrio sp.]|uniref:alginate O-acetyltransferase AlgX-related protein n=1 Tax=Desulfolutivibrio sp. TaxID=2773296 RepID=UPI002F965266